MTTDQLSEWGSRIADENRGWLEARPEPTADARLDAIRAELARRHRATRARATRVRWTLGLAAAVAMVASLFVLVPRGDARRDFGATAAGATLHTGERLVARTRSIDVSFEDGSRVELTQGTEVAVERLDPGEIAVRFLGGGASVHVVHEEGRTWWLRGGDHAIEVVGTAFDIRYDAASASLEVDLREGRLRAVGPCADAARVFEAPVRFVVACARERADERTPSPEATRPAIPTAMPTAMPSTSGTTTTPSWRLARERGDLRAAFELASDAGLDAAAASASAAELVDLALGARLAGSRSAATRLYLLARERFAGSDAAATSAFHLGRSAFDESGAWAEAERWFSIYLAERPGGTLAGEALGRSMEAAERQGAAERARVHAAAYLARYPSGPLAERARKLVDAGGVTREPPGPPP